MAASTALVSNHTPGDLREVIMDVTGDTSYPTGGYAVAVPGMASIVFVDATAPPASGHIPAWDYAAGKLKFFTSGGTEVVAATNLSTAVARVSFLGRGTA